MLCWSCRAVLCLSLLIYSYQVTADDGVCLGQLAAETVLNNLDNDVEDINIRITQGNFYRGEQYLSTIKTSQNYFDNNINNFKLIYGPFDNLEFIDIYYNDGEKLRLPVHANGIENTFDRVDCRANHAGIDIVPRNSSNFDFILDPDIEPTRPDENDYVVSDGDRLQYVNEDNGLVQVRDLTFHNPGYRGSFSEPISKVVPNVLTDLTAPNICRVLGVANWFMDKDRVDDIQEIIEALEDVQFVADLAGFLPVGGVKMTFRSLQKLASLKMPTLSTLSRKAWIQEMALKSPNRIPRKIRNDIADIMYRKYLKTVDPEVLNYYHYAKRNIDKWERWYKASEKAYNKARDGWERSFHAAGLIKDRDRFFQAREFIWRWKGIFMTQKRMIRSQLDLLPK